MANRDIKNIIDRAYNEITGPAVDSIHNADLDSDEFIEAYLFLTDREALAEQIIEAALFQLKTLGRLADLTTIKLAVSEKIAKDDEIDI